MMSTFDNAEIELQDDTEILTDEQIKAIMAEGLELMSQDIANGEYPETWDSWPCPDEIADYEREQLSLRAARTFTEGE